MFSRYFGPRYFGRHYFGRFPLISTTGALAAHPAATDASAALLVTGAGVLVAATGSIDGAAQVIDHVLHAIGDLDADRGNVDGVVRIEMSAFGGLEAGDVLVIAEGITSPARRMVIVVLY